MRPVLLLAAAMALPAAVRSEVISFTVPVVADYEFSLVGGTPLNPGPTTPFIPFRAVGPLTFSVSPMLNDPSRPTTVPFTGLSGVLNGVPPSPPNTLPHYISPNVQFLGGNLTNIVRDVSGEVISADVSNLNAMWELVGTGPAFPVRLYSDAGLPFDATGVTLPFAPGTVLAGAAPFNVFLDDGDGNRANDVLVAIGRNRTLTVAAVPEPVAVVVFGLTMVGLVAGQRRARGFAGGAAS
jgi:hypothetical protein